MTVRKLLERSEYGIRTYPPYMESHVEIRPKHSMQGDILSEDEAIEKYGDCDVWLAYHSEGTMKDPVNGEHVYAICIE